MIKDHPFQVGTRVVIISREFDGDPTYRLGIVGKVHKTGHFALTSGPIQKWRAWKIADGWSADPVGDTSWNRARLVLWDEKIDKNIYESLIKRKRKHRWRKLQEQFTTLPFASITDGMLDDVERAITMAQALKEEPHGD